MAGKGINALYVGRECDWKDLRRSRGFGGGVVQGRARRE